MASILLALQGANWQRGGGKGDKPKRLERPRETGTVSTGIKSSADLAARKTQLKKEKRRRAQAK